MSDPKNSNRPPNEGESGYNEWLANVVAPQIRAANALAEARIKTVPKGATARVGQRVHFQRGMFGQWEGRVERFYKSRGWGTCGFDAGKLFAVVSFRLKNGKSGEARVRADHLKPIQEAQ